jgi:hypothetical protein
MLAEKSASVYIPEEILDQGSSFHCAVLAVSEEKRSTR